MSLGSALHIEPYGGYGDEDCGVAIVYRDYVDFVPYERWSNESEFGDDERRLIRGAVSRSNLWSRPTSGLPARYAEYLREFDDYPEGLDEAQGLAYSRERMQRILGDIGRRIVRSLPHNIYLKRDTDYEILAMMAVSSYFRDQFPFSPLICVHGAQNSGKSSVLETMAGFLYRGRFSHGYTGASIGTSVDRDGMSVLMDEVGLNLNTDRGQAILEFLLGSCYQGRTIERHDFDRDANRTRSIYTTCMIALKGADIPDDIRSRSLMIEMPLSKKGRRTRSVSMRKFIEYEPGTSPEEIRDDLYALMLITRQSRGTQFGEGEHRGIWFDSFQRETMRQLETEIAPGSGVFLYSVTYDLESVEINNRDEDIALMALTVGDCMGFGRDIMARITSNARQAVRQRSQTTSGRMFEAFARVVRAAFEDEGIGYGDIEGKDIVRLVRRIRISDASREYREMTRDDGTGGEWSDRALYDAFSDLGFVHTKQGMHNGLRVDGDDPGFLRQFARCLEIYADDETRRFYAAFIASMGEDPDGLRGRD